MLVGEPLAEERDRADVVNRFGVYPGGDEAASREPEDEQLVGGRLIRPASIYIGPVPKKAA